MEEYYKRLRIELDTKIHKTVNKADFAKLRSGIDDEIEYRAIVENNERREKFKSIGVDISSDTTSLQDVPVSEDTLMRLYDYGGKRGENWKLGTNSRKTLARVLGYEDWDDFVRECDDNKPVHCDKIYDLYKLDSDDDDALMSLETGTKIRFELGSSDKNFIVEKNDDHSFSYTILSIIGLKLRRKVGDTFYAPYFIVKNDEKTNEPIVLIEDDGWFDEPENEDIKCQEDYCILRFSRSVKAQKKRQKLYNTILSLFSIELSSFNLILSPHRQV